MGMEDNELLEIQDFRSGILSSAQNSRRPEPFWISVPIWVS